MSNPAAAAAQKQPDAVPNVSDSVRLPPILDPQAFQWNGQAYAVWREAMVRCPPGMRPTDLHEHPGVVWKKIQSNPNTSLQRFDRVLVVGDAEEWCLDAMVADADSTKVVLGNHKIIMLQQRGERYVTPDGYFTVLWAGAGYQAFRLQDGGKPAIPLSIGIFDNFEACKLELHRTQYARRVG